MKSLQVVTPHMECIFNCPFCIAKTHEHNNKFVNNYELNFDMWKNNLIKVINENADLKYIVITGTNEPMQSKNCVNDIIDTVREVNKDIQIEIQTHYYKQDNLFDMVDVVAYSIDNISLLNKIKPSGKMNRFVLVLTDSFDNYSLDDIIRLIPDNVSQLTLKCLHDSKGVNKEVDEYILNHKVDKGTLDRLKEEINNYYGNLSIRLDEFCMDSKGRYKVFREDGMIYDNWEQYHVR